MKSQHHDGAAVGDPLFFKRLGNGAGVTEVSDLRAIEAEPE